MASCARQDEDIQKFQLLVMSKSIFKSYSVIALYISHTENEIGKKTERGGDNLRKKLILKTSDFITGPNLSSSWRNS